ncbi:ParB/RepB/Spo0J family partition protein [Ferrovibrio terrae]|uniref:ParB/RepB/Spo0J family partition protein n=1 Tax=Ferrovibrio terrae TaxID=2594003 RepID=UPI003138412F
MTQTETTIERIERVIKTATGQTPNAALRELGMSENTFRNAKLKGGEPSSQLVQAFADHLGVTTDYLYGRVPVGIGIPIVLKHGQLRPSPLNPRKTFDMLSIAEMGSSMAARGQLQEILVRRTAGMRFSYDIIAGERRWRGIGHAGSRGDWNLDAPNVRCLLLDISDRDHLLASMVENKQRQAMTDMDEAEGFATLKAMGVSAAEQARETGLKERYIQQRIAVTTKLASEVKDALREERIDFTRARALCELDDEAAQRQFLANMDRYPRSEDLERAVRAFIAASKDAPAAKPAPDAGTLYLALSSGKVSPAVQAAAESVGLHRATPTQELGDKTPAGRPLSEIVRSQAEQAAERHRRTSAAVNGLPKIGQLVIQYNPPVIGAGRIQIRAAARFYRSLGRDDIASRFDDAEASIHDALAYLSQVEDDEAAERKQAKQK